jgi:peptide/nickel transport system substrate-binding protein
MRVAWLIALLLIWALPAGAQKGEDTLRITWRDAVVDLDPYYNAQRTGFVLAHHVWDGLVDRDPETFQIKPLLARSYRWASDTTLEFELRQGVTFHNGDSFTADDVVYTVNTVIADKRVAVPTNYTYLAGAEKIDDYHVRVKLRRPFPAAIEFLAMVLPIWPKAYREQVGEEEYARAPIGTGPYRITRVVGPNEIDLERFDRYFADSPKGRPAIEKLRIRQVADATSELADLLSGRADWIWQYNPDQFETIDRVPTLQALRAESMRIGYLSLDAAGRSGANNPLTQEKVRQAIFYAIDRQTIARQLGQGDVRPLDGPCYPTQFGCNQAAPVRYPYDPQRAKQLLAEAGYANGFETELVSYMLPQWTGAIRNYLKAVGIAAHVKQLPVSAATELATEGRVPLYLASWGSYSINDVSAILPFFFTGGPNDYAGDPEVARLIAAGDGATDPDQRRRQYDTAIRLIMSRAYWLPLTNLMTTYGISRELNFKPFPDELPRFYLASWK